MGGGGAAGDHRDQPSAALLTRSMRIRGGTHSDAGHGGETDPTWLEHTLEIKDDQNKGSQTGGANHPANAAHPHQVSQSLLHGRCSLGAAGLSGSLEVPRRIWLPVNGTNASTAERTITRTSGGG